MNGTNEPAGSRAVEIQQGMYERQEAARQRRRSAVRSFAANHVGLLASTGFVLLVSIRFLSAAHGDWTTAIALASSGTGVTTLIPLIYNAITVTAPFLVVLAFIRVAEPPSLRSAGIQSRSARVFYVAALSLPALALAPWTSTLLCAAIGVPLLWAIPAQRRANQETIRLAVEGDKVHQWRLGTLQADTTMLGVFACAALGLTFSYFIDTMWLPTEAAVIDDSPRTVYVLSSDDDDLVVLLDEGRTVRRFHRNDVGPRQLCSDMEARPSVFGLLWGTEPDYDECP